MDINATGKDITISGSSVVADNDVTLKAKENVTITSQEETSSSDYQKQVKKSGLLSGGGLSFSIGKEKQKDTYANQNIEQAGSIVGSIDGNVTIEAGKDVTAQASDVIAGQDISLTGETVTIESKDNTYNAQEKHEYKKSGLTVSIGGKTVEAVGKVVAPLERATQVKDKRLAALYGYKVYDELTDKTTKKDLEGIKDPQKNFTVEVSLGSQKSESKAQSSTTLAQGSNVTAGGDVTIQATKDDINIHGSNVSGENVSLKAQENINITASENTNTTDQTSKSSSGSIGVSISAGGISGINAGYNKAKGEVKENSTAYNPSSVTASDTLTLESGKDTNIIGSKVSGDTVKADVGENLNIESLQEKESYDEKNSSSGLSISADISKNDLGKTVTGKPGMQGSANKGKIKSDYQSVTEQAGIYAGEGGFNIEVGKNTDLKGAVISSEATPDKNKLSTDTLTWSDIENKAEYSASSVGVNLDTRKNAEKKDAGLTPDIGIPVSGDASSTTQSAIAPGTIEVRSNPDQDLSNLSRDPSGALNALGQIFDKKTVQERQELAKVFGEVAFKEIGDYALRMQEKATTPEEKAKWADGGEYKVFLHTVAGGLMSQLGGGSFTSGAMGAAVNEAVQKALAEKFKDNPAMHQWASAVLGAAAAKVVGGNAQTGASTAASGTKNNWLNHRQQVELAEKLSKATSDEERLKILKEYEILNQINIMSGVDPDTGLPVPRDPVTGQAYEIIEPDLLNELNKLKMPGSFGTVNFGVDNSGLNNNLARAREFLHHGNETLVVGKNVGESLVDAAAGKLIIDQLRTSFTIGKVSAPSLGPAATLEIRVDTTPKSTIILKNVAKVAGGVVAVGQTSYDVYVDYKTFGLTKNFALAASADVATTVVVGIGSSIAVSAGAPVIAVAVIGGGVVYLVNKEKINPWKDTLK